MKNTKKRLTKVSMALATAIVVGSGVSGVSMMTSDTEAVYAGTNGKTVDDAINWCKSKLGMSLDVDGVYGAQCVDFTKAYYQFLGQNAVLGSGKDYITNALPSGWTRIAGATPRKGDILVYYGNNANPAGHVAIYESDYSTYHQNFGGNGRVTQITSIKYNGFTNAYYGVIRPDFSSNPVPSSNATWNNTVNSVTTDNLGVKGRVSFSSKKHFSKAGFQIWDSDGNLMKNFSENANWNSSYMDIYYNDVRSEIGVTLKPGTVYTYQYYAVADGQTHYSPKYTKQTNWPGVQNIGEDFYGMIMNESWNPLRVEPNDNIVLGRERNGEWSRLIWHFKRNSDGSYTITSVGDGKAFEVAGADDLDRANVRTWPSNGSNAQKWFIYVVDNKYVFRPACSQTRVLDVQGYSTAEGANIMIYHHHNTSNERFSVYKIQDYTSYSINTEKSEIKTGQSTGITINDTKYAYNYKLHIVKPDGSEKVVDNGEKNTYTFSETTPGTYKVYAEVKGSINTARGSASDRYCTIKVQSNDTRTGVYNVNGTWKYLKNGQHDNSFTGVAKSSKGNWIFVRNGVYDTYFTGVAKSTKGNWIYVNSGRYDAGFTGVAKSTKGNWIFVRNGRYDAGFTGVAKSTKGNWIYVKNGRYDTSFTGVAKSTKGNRLYIVNGKWKNSFTGKYKNYNIKKGYVV